MTWQFRKKKRKGKKRERREKDVIHKQIAQAQCVLRAGFALAALALAYTAADSGDVAHLKLAFFELNC